MKTIVSALLALSVLAGIAAPASALRRQELLRAAGSAVRQLTGRCHLTKSPRARARGLLLCAPYSRLARPDSPPLDGERVRGGVKTRRVSVQLRRSDGHITNVTLLGYPHPQPLPARGRGARRPHATRSPAKRILRRGDHRQVGEQVLRLHLDPLAWRPWPGPDRPACPSLSPAPCARRGCACGRARRCWPCPRSGGVLPS